MYDRKCHLSYFAATANQELAPDVKSARGIRESVGTTEIDTPRCQPQVCCTNGGRRGKKWQAVWNTVGSGSAAHITPQVSSSVFDQKNLASCTLKQTRHSQLMCFGLMWLLVTSKHWQRADRADSMFYVCKLGQKNNTDFLSSPPKVPLTFSSFAVCNYAAYKSRQHTSTLQRSGSWPSEMFGFILEIWWKQCTSNVCLNNFMIFML